MSHWEDHDFDPFLDEKPEPDDFSVTCKYCGQDGLAWVDLFGGWRLVDSDGDIHSCARPKSKPADDFSQPLKPAPKLKRSARTGRPICKCGKGYASEHDGLCSQCRAKLAKRAKR